MNNKAINEFGFRWLYIEILYGHTEIRNVSSSVEKCFSNEHRERVKYFFRQPCKVLFII